MVPIKHDNNGKRYNDDFRKMLVDFINSGQPVKSLSSEYGVSEVTIYAWIKKFNPIELEDGSSVTPDDYAKLQKQILKLQQENDSLEERSQMPLEDLARVTQRTNEISKELLSSLANPSVLERLGTGTGKNYILSQRVSKRLKGNLGSERNHELNEECVKLQLISYMNNKGKMTCREIVQMTGWTSQQVYPYMVSLREQKIVQSKGLGKAAYYCLYND